MVNQEPNPHGWAVSLNKFLIDVLWAVALLLPIEAIKLFIARWADAEVIYVFVGVPMFVLLYYRGARAGIIGAAILIASEYWLFMHPLGVPWYSKRFLSLTVLMVAGVPFVAHYVPRWRRQLEEERDASRKLTDAAKYRDLLLGTLGHDLRTPLASIHATAQLLKVRAPEYIEELRRIERSCMRMVGMIDQVLDMTTIHLGGGIKLSLTHVDLIALITRAIDEAMLLYPKAVIRLSCRERRVVGLWDAVRVERTVMNLLTNACKYGDPEQPIVVSVTDHGAQVMFSVHNDGEPIPPVLLPMLFNPFTRGNETVKIKGLGLGLYITAEMVDKHGGSIDVRSTREEGTTFTVTLPKGSL